MHDSSFKNTHVSYTDTMNINYAVRNIESIKHKILLPYPRHTFFISVFINPELEANSCNSIHILNPQSISSSSCISMQVRKKGRNVWPKSLLADIPIHHYIKTLFRTHITQICYHALGFQLVVWTHLNPADTSSWGESKHCNRSHLVPEQCLWLLYAAPLHEGI